MALFTVMLLTAAPPDNAALAGGAFVKVDGRECLLRSSELFVNRQSIIQIQVVVAEDAMEDAKRRFASHLSFTGVKLVAGGEKWHEQMRAAAGSIDASATHVIIHDAARPAVPFSDIDALLEAAEQHPAVALTTPLRARLVEVDGAGKPMDYRYASEFVELLTPRIFRKDHFEEMIRLANNLPAHRLHLIKGSPLNIRVGGTGDAALAKTMLKMLPTRKTRAPLNPFEEAQW